MKTNAIKISILSLFMAIIALLALFCANLNTSPTLARAEETETQESLIIINVHSKGEIIKTWRFASEGGGVWNNMTIKYWFDSNEASNSEDSEAFRAGIDWDNLKGWSFSEDGLLVNLNNYYIDKDYDVYAVYTDKDYAPGELDTDKPDEQPPDEEQEQQTGFVEKLDELYNLIGITGLSLAAQLIILAVVIIIICRFVFR